MLLNPCLKSQRLTIYMCNPTNSFTRLNPSTYCTLLPLSQPWNFERNNHKERHNRQHRRHDESSSQRRSIGVSNLFTIHGLEIRDCSDGFPDFLDDLDIMSKSAKHPIRGRAGSLTSSLSGPTTSFSRYINSAFCSTKLLVATPNTFPIDLHSISVEVTTA